MKRVEWCSSGLAQEEEEKERIEKKGKKKGGKGGREGRIDTLTHRPFV